MKKIIFAFLVAVTAVIALPAFAGEVNVELKSMKASSEDVLVAFDQAVQRSGATLQQAGSMGGGHIALKSSLVATINVSGKGKARLITINVKDMNTTFGFFGQQPKDFLETILSKMKDSVDDLEVTPL